MRGSNSSLPVTSSPTVLANDDVVVQFGTDGDNAIVHRSASLTANTALTNVIVGTPVVSAIPANSLIVSNITADGDIVFITQTGGNSQELLRLDGSAGDIIATGDIMASNANGGALLNEAAGSTNPTLVPDRSNLTSGLGYSGGVPWLIASGTGIAFWSSAGIEMQSKLISGLSNFSVGGSTWGTNADHVIAIVNGTPPSTDVTDQFQMYAADVNSEAALHIRGEGGDITSIGEQILAPDGSASRPSLGFRSDQDTGFFYSASNVIQVAAGGSAVANFGNSTIVMNSGSGNIDFIWNGDTTSNQFYLDAGLESCGVGTGSINASAKLEVSSTTKGFLPPRMTTTQRDAISTPATGLVIYNTTTNVFNFYNGSMWGAV